MAKRTTIKKEMIMTFLLSCVINVSCINSSSGGHQGTKQEECNMDTLESGVICYNIDSNTVIDYSYVSPSTAKRYAYVHR